MSPNPIRRLVCCFGRRFGCDLRGFTGAEKALLVAFALAIVALVGHLVSQGSVSAGSSARRVLFEQAGASAALRSVGAEQTPRATEEGGPEAPVAAQPVAQPAPPATTAPAVQSPDARTQFLTSYRTWLEARLTEVNALSGQPKVARVEGLLLQLRDVNAQVQAGQHPDLGTLDTQPAGQSTEVAVASTFLAPQLITPARQLIQIIERPVTGATQDAGAVLGGDLYSARDWNALLGVPQYRTQSDNLVGPEVTCNVTSTSMVLERLGYNRQDVQSAIEREMKSRIARQRGLDPATTDLSQIELPPNAWEQAASRYLNDNAAAAQTYQRVRGVNTTPQQREALSRQFHDNAKTQDMLDLLLHMKGISRYEVGTRAGDILRLIQPDAAQRPTADVISPSARMSWADARAELRRTLDAGGGAMLSLYHKGAGQDGTHLISIQAVTEHGVIVDDPYGRIRATYRRSQPGDAYADPGRTRAGSNYRNVVHRPADGSVGTQWHLDNGQDLGDDESRGNSVEVSDDVLSGAWNRITLYRRPAVVARQP